MKREVVFVIVGSRKLDAVPARVLGLIANMPDGTVLNLRKPRSGKPEFFESAVGAAARAMSIEVRYKEPEGPGRESTYYRDIDMVRGASCVLAFFAEEEMSGGTEHVVEKAIDQQVPVYSYGLRDGRWVLIGSHDPDDLWPQFTI